VLWIALPSIAKGFCRSAIHLLNLLTASYRHWSHDVGREGVRLSFGDFRSFCQLLIFHGNREQRVVAQAIHCVEVGESSMTIGQPKQ
jgi:hypothetical protein